MFMNLLYEAFVESFTEMVLDYVLDDPMREETTLGPMVRTKKC